MKIKKLVYMLEEKERNIGLPTGVRRFVCRGVVAQCGGIGGGGGSLL